MTQVLRAFLSLFPPCFFFLDLFRRYIQPADPGGLSSDGRFPPCQKASPLSLRGTNDDDSITVSRGVAPGGQAMRHEPCSGTCYITTVTVPPPSRRISIHPVHPIHPSAGAAAGADAAAAAGGAVSRGRFGRLFPPLHPTQSPRLLLSIKHHHRHQPPQTRSSKIK